MGALDLPTSGANVAISTTYQIIEQLLLLLQLLLRIRKLQSNSERPYEERI